MDTDPPLADTQETFQTFSLLSQTGIFFLLGLFFLLLAVLYNSGQGKRVLYGWPAKLFHSVDDSENEQRAMEKQTAKYITRLTLFLSYSCFFFTLYYILLGRSISPVVPTLNIENSLLYSWLLSFFVVILIEAFLPVFILRLNQTNQKRLFSLLQWLWLPTYPVLNLAFKRTFRSEKNNHPDSAGEHSSPLNNQQILENHHEAGYEVSSGRDVYSKHNSGSFKYITAKQIMCPRMDISAVPDTFSFSEVMDFITSTGYSRFPVYQGDLDTITGILYVKDILPFVLDKGKVNWKKWVRKEVLFVPESIKIEMLLREFQNRRQHMAIIVDEYGGTSGIATLEDVMEELVGEIRDELDGEEEQVFQKLTDYQFLFDGKTLLQDVCRITGLPFGFFDSYRKEADSLGGLILEASGNLPLQGKEFHFGRVSLLVQSVNKSRIERVRLEITEYEQD